MNIEDNQFKFARVGIIGLGYVGLPLACLFINKGYTVVGIDIDQQKINALKSATSYIEDVKNDELKEVIETGRLSFSMSYDEISNVDAIIICVPTPLTSYGTPDMSFVQETTINLYARLQPNQLVVLESSTYPGTTKEVIQPILEKSGLEVGKNLFLAYSPERIDPGNKYFKVEEVPKVISGVTDICLDKASALYNKIFDKLVPVSSPEVAELSKLLENSYRYINISFINEIAILADFLNINIWDAIQAASTKPYGFMPFYPSSGAGGHCIPVDPIYLSWKSKQAGHHIEFIELANKINKYMVNYILLQIEKRLPDNHLVKKNILIYGIAYKKDISDYRESPALHLMSELYRVGANISYHDPYIPEVKVDNVEYKSINLTKELLENADCVVILTDHSSIPIKLIVEHSRLIYDTKNVTSEYAHKVNIFRLGGGSV